MMKEHEEGLEGGALAREVKMRARRVLLLRKERMVPRLPLHSLTM